VVLSVIGGDVRVQLFVDRERAEFVSAIDFDASHPFAEEKSGSDLNAGGGS
jgi:hypothetical protein